MNEVPLELSVVGADSSAVGTELNAEGTEFNAVGTVKVRIFYLNHRSVINRFKLGFLILLIYTAWLRAMLFLYPVWFMHLFFKF